VQLAEDV